LRTSVSGVLVFLFLLAHGPLVGAAGGEDDEKKGAPRAQKKEGKPAAKASPVPSYTDEDLKRVSPRSEGEGEATEAPPPSTYEETPSSSEVSETPAPVESEWRQRAQDARAAVQAAEMAVREADEEAKALAQRILLSTDTYEIMELRSQQQQRTEQLEAARAAVTAAQKALVDLEDEARRARVPPGWLREP
jgi:hypothetical protein